MIARLNVTPFCPPNYNACMKTKFEEGVRRPSSSEFGKHGLGHIYGLELNGVATDGVGYQTVKAPS